MNSVIGAAVILVRIEEGLAEDMRSRPVHETAGNEGGAMTKSFDESYPNIAWWVQGGGGIELGRDDCRRSLIRVLDIEGMLWEGQEEYDSMGTAMDEAEALTS
jgi:hypothetical protein